MCLEIKESTRTGLALVLLCCHVQWATLMSLVLSCQPCRWKSQTVTVQSAAVTSFSVTLNTCSSHLLECCCTSLSFLILLAPPILLFNVITLHVGLLFAFFTDFTSDSVYVFTSVLSNCPSNFFHYYYWPLLYSTILCPQADSPRSCRKWFWMSDCSLFMACIFYFNIHWNVVVN